MQKDCMLCTYLRRLITVENANILRTHRANIPGFPVCDSPGKINPLYLNIQKAKTREFLLTFYEAECKTHTICIFNIL